MKENDKSIKKFNHRFLNFQFSYWNRIFHLLSSHEEMVYGELDILMKMEKFFRNGMLLKLITVLWLFICRNLILNEQTYH